MLMAVVYQGMVNSQKFLFSDATIEGVMKLRNFQILFGLLVLFLTPSGLAIGLDQVGRGISDEYKHLNTFLSISSEKIFS